MLIQKTSKTVNDAIDEALKELNVTIDQIDYEVVQQPTKGFFGIGKKNAIVNVKVKKQLNLSDLDDDIDVIKIEKSNIKPKNYNPNAIEIAEKFLKEIFEAMNIDICLEAQIIDKKQVLINLDGKNIGAIIGKHGQTLDALQYLVNLFVNKGDYSYTFVNLDSQDYRKRRCETLEKLALKLANRVKDTKKSITLEPMNPYERRIIHSKLQYDKNIKTYSEGHEPNRYVVICPKK